MVLHILITVIYTIVNFVGTFSSAGAAYQDTNKAWDMEKYFQKYETRITVGNALTFGLAPAERFEIELDAPLEEMFDKIKEDSGFDARRILDSWPDIYFYNRWLYALMPGQLNELRDNLMAKGDQAQLDGDWVGMALYRILGVSAGMPTKVKLAAEEASPGLYDIIIYATYGDGSQVRFNPYIQYDKANTGTVNQEPNHPGGIVGTGFAMNVGEAYAFNTRESPQRALGYIKLYDDIFLSGNDMVDLDTVRLKFPYDGRDWMLQLWKGRYFITTGGEIGIYNKPKSRLIEFYDTASNDELIDMSFRVRLKETNELLIDRPITNHWWMTGYAVRKIIYGPSKITLETDIVPYDAEMSEALREALDKEKAAGTLNYTVDDSGIISIVW